jgi:hypothetical protein
MLKRRKEIVRAVAESAGIVAPIVADARLRPRVSSLLAKRC